MNKRGTTAGQRQSSRRSAISGLSVGRLMIVGGDFGWRCCGGATATRAALRCYALLSPCKQIGHDALTFGFNQLAQEVFNVVKVASSPAPAANTRRHPPPETVATRNSTRVAAGESEF